MELKRISFRSAVFFGVAYLIMSFISGLVSWIISMRVPEFQQAIGPIDPLKLLIIVPIFGGIIAYVLALILIWAYNLIAKKNPISWELDR